MKKSLSFKAFAVLLFTGSLLTGCSQGSEFPQPASATGVCFSMISSVGPDNKILSYHQLLLVKSSGNVATDINRLRTFSAERFPFRSPDMVPNKWWGAWLMDERFDATHGPDCSGLPMVDAQ